MARKDKDVAPDEKEQDTPVNTTVAAKGAKPASPLPELPEGWAWVNQATSKGWAVKDGGETLYSQKEPVYVAVPVTLDALIEAISYETTFETPDGIVTVTGVEALAARQYFGGYEGALRGPVRDDAANRKELTPELIQMRAATVRPFNGRSGGGKTLPEAQVNEMLASGDVEALKKLMRAKGMLA